MSAERDRRYHLAQLYFSTGRHAQAVELFQGLIAENDNADLRCSLALCFFAENQMAEAEAALDTVAVAEMPSPLPKLILGRVRLAQGRLDEALALLEPLGREDFPFSYLHTALGQVYARRGMLPEAEAAYRRALDRVEANAEAHDSLGTILRRTSRYEDAVYHHMRSAALHHVRPATHVNLGVALARTQQFDWSIRAFEVAVELAPNHLFAHRCLMQLYRNVKGDEGKAREHSDRAVAIRKARMEARDAAEKAAA